MPKVKKTNHRVHFVFLDESRSGWAWLAPRGFRHVLFFIEDSHGNVWHCNPYMPFCINQGSTIEGFDDLVRRVMRLRGAHRVVSVEVRQWVSRGYVPLGVWLCHTLAKCLSGVDVGFVWSPHHLYRKLIKYHAARNFDVLLDIPVHPI